MTGTSDAPKDPATAMAIEVVCGYLGLMGIGYMYAGRTTGGVVRLLGWWFTLIALALALTVLGGLSVLGGLFAAASEDYGGWFALSSLVPCCLFPIAAVLVTVAPVASGLMLKRSMEGA